MWLKAKAINPKVNGTFYFEIKKASPIAEITSAIMI